MRYKTESINTILTRILNKEELSHDLESYFNDDTNQRDFLFAASQFNLEEQQKIIRALFLTSPDYIGVVDYAQRNRLTCLKDLIHHIVKTRLYCADILVLKGKQTCWKIVASYARPETLDIFLVNHRFLLKAKDATCMLMSAIDKGRLDMVEFLLNKKFPAPIACNSPININAEDEEGYTPLQLAIKHENQQMIDLLLNHGAVPVHSSEYYRTNPYRPSYTKPDEKSAITPNDSMPFLGGVREHTPRPSFAVKKSPLEIEIACGRNEFLLSLWKSAFLVAHKTQPSVAADLDKKLEKLLSIKINFYAELDLLLSKAKNLEKREKHTAYRAANCLYHGLKQEADYYFANPTECSSEAFLERCQSLLEAGYKSELVRHRGPKKILGAIALAISSMMTLGLGAVAFILASKATTGKYFFFNHTDSKERMDRIGRCVIQVTSL